MAKGKSTVSWFFESKLHIVINDCGEIIQWTLTLGNTDDREPLKHKNFTQRLFGKLFADRGYISQDFFEALFVDDIHLVTKIRKNMKNSLMNLYDKILLRKRVLRQTQECLQHRTYKAPIGRQLCNKSGGRTYCV